MNQLKELTRLGWKIMEKFIEVGAILLPGTEAGLLTACITSSLELRERCDTLQARVIELEEMVIRLSDSVADMSQPDDLIQ